MKPINGEHNYPHINKQCPFVYLSTQADHVTRDSVNPRGAGTGRSGVYREIRCVQGGSGGYREGQVGTGRVRCVQPMSSTNHTLKEGFLWHQIDSIDLYVTPLTSNIENSLLHVVVVLSL